MRAKKIKPVKDLAYYRREHKKLKEHLADIVKVVSMVLVELDVVMKGPSTPERGKKIAALANNLEMARDIASHFGLGRKL